MTKERPRRKQPLRLRKNKAIVVQEESNPKKPIGFISGIALGAAVAGAASFLYKTKKGKKNQKRSRRLLSGNFGSFERHR